MHKDNKGAIFLDKNSQVGMCTKYINICHKFLRNMVEEKDMDIKYIWIKENPVDTMTNIFLNMVKPNMQREPCKKNSGVL